MKLRYNNYEEPVSLKDFNDGEERIVFILCPSWTVQFPPTGVSKMVGVTRDAGYACKVYDLNIQTYHYLMTKTDKNFWRSENQFYWQYPEFYEKHLSSLIDPYMLKVVDRIVEDNPTIIGFSLYTTSLESSIYLIKKLRERLPHVKIVIGGTYASMSGEWMVANRFRNNEVDHIFVSEAEETFINFLKNGGNSKEKVIGKIGGKINLDNTAFADYSDYDLSAYIHPGNISLETSRGCIANCIFCNESHFWKFRTINPTRVIAEIKHLKQLGFYMFVITDSLINGNLKHLNELVELIISNDLNIKWHTYIRCDGRMDEKFIYRMAKAGCVSLSFGVESGSEKVLSDMRKGIKIWEIEENIKHAFKYKIQAQVNWIIGFPTEDLIDYYHSNILVYNLRKYITSLAPGMGCQLVNNSGLSIKGYEDDKLYGIERNEYEHHRYQYDKFLNNWYTSDFKNTHLNRFIRLKMFHIYLMILESNAGSFIYNGQKYDNMGDFYEFITINKNTEKYITQELNIDFNVIKTVDGVTDFSRNIGNEFFPMFYQLYKIFGGFNIKIIFNPEKEFESWGTLSDNYRAIGTFNINDIGEYNCTIEHEFKHYPMSSDLETIYNTERSIFGDMSFKNCFNLNGNINNWLSDASLVRPPIVKNVTQTDVSVVNPPIAQNIAQTDVELIKPLTIRKLI